MKLAAARFLRLLLQPIEQQLGVAARPSVRIGDQIVHVQILPPCERLRNPKASRGLRPPVFEDDGELVALLLHALDRLGIFDIALFRKMRSKLLHEFERTLNF
ncbi:hypothetical protein D3C84_1061100 [compost metagenome]